MKLIQTRRPLWTVLFVCAAVTALAAHALFAERQVTTGVTLKLCKKNASGGWDIIETARGTLNFTAKVADAANGQINTDHVWAFRGDKGSEGTTQVKPGRFNFDSKSGLLTFNLPFEVALRGGKRITRNVELTTESLATPIGQLSGKRAVVQGDSLSAILIGFTTFPARELVGGPPAIAGAKLGNNDELAVTVEFDARAKK